MALLRRGPENRPEYPLPERRPELGGKAGEGLSRRVLSSRPARPADGDRSLAQSVETPGPEFKQFLDFGPPLEKLLDELFRDARKLEPDGAPEPHLLDFKAEPLHPVGQGRPVDGSRGHLKVR